MLKLCRSLFNRSIPRSRGQSFLELALVLPILLFILLGLVEVAFFMGKYLDALDLTREAARFGSVRDPFGTMARDYDCFTQSAFDYFWDTSCIFSQPDAELCAASVDLGGGSWLNWCNGLNKYLDFNPATDDVVISLYTVGLDNAIQQTHPAGTEYVIDEDGNTSYYWALSNHYAAGAVSSPLVDNFKKDCHGVKDNSKRPYYTRHHVQSMNGATLSAGDFPSGALTSPPGNKGYIAVEIYYCHAQVLGLPLIVDILPNPVMIHAYTIMPLPAAAPTPTPAAAP